ncbi:MAG: hypothetical protein ACRDI3_06185, partial [Actinomycetota bacterium]
MDALRWVAFGAGIALILWTGAGVVRTLIVPRGLQSKLPQLIARSLQRGFLLVARRFDTYEARDRVLAFQAPTFLLALLAAWMTFFLLGSALMLWPMVGSFSTALLESGSSLFTLGFAATRSTGPTIVHFVAAGTGLVIIALLIGYLPTLYGAFNRREIAVTTLQSRAGAPAWGPELLWRYNNVGLLPVLNELYAEWERWAADVAETHTNYPALIFFRSPHPLRNWVLGLLAVMDSAAMCLALAPTLTPVEARLCLRMGFLCFRDIAAFLQIPYDPDPLPDEPIELTFEEFASGAKRLVDGGFPVERSFEAAWPHFRGWRVNYESVAYRLADVVSAAPGPWSGPRTHM